MQTLAEKPFIGKWRSYKLFKRTGDIRLDTEQRFKELEFSVDRLLTIRTYNKREVKTVVKTNEWALFFKDKKHYLAVACDQLLYEVITVNHTVLVLSDSASLDKAFFAKEAHWQEYLKSNIAMPL